MPVALVWLWWPGGGHDKRKDGFGTRPKRNNNTEWTAFGFFLVLRASVLIRDLLMCIKGN